MNLRHLEIVQYKEYLKVDIQQTCKKYATIKQWAYILHDKDDTAPHYHIYLNFGKSSVDTKLVAKWFELGYKDEKTGEEHDGTQFIEKVKGRKTDVLSYLTHSNESQKNKHQYSTSEVIANFDFVAEVESAKIIGDFKNHTYAQMLQYIDTLAVTEKPKALNQLKKLWELHCLTASLEKDRNINVMFVTGKGGTGKTYYAKKFLESFNYDYSISSSSNDPLQDYLGQKGLLLDDLRDETFKFEDLLKLIDNDTQSSISSRFHNKVFVGDMIVITSSVPIRFWYKELRTSSLDSLNQLYRRINCYVEVLENEVIVYYDGLDEKGQPKGLGQVFKNEVAELKTKKPKKFDFKTAFEKICSVETADFPF